MAVLGINYKKIHACSIDFILYLKGYENLNEFPTYRESRWKKQANGAVKKIKISYKVIWYFLIIPWLKRMF